MLNHNRLPYLEDQLIGLLPDLLASKIECIEYGSKTVRALSCLRIRYMQTAGGMQLQVAMLGRNMEHGRAYFHLVDDAVNYTMRQIITYHKPISHEKIRKYLEQKRKERGEGIDGEKLEFFVITNDDVPPHMIIDQKDCPISNDAVTFTLTL